MNIYLLFNYDIVNFLLKTDEVGKGGMGVGVQKVLFCYYCFLGCSNCWWVRCGGFGQKVLFRTGWNRMFLFIQGCEGFRRVFSFLFFFLGGGRGSGAPVFLNNISTYFPEISGYTGWRPFFFETDFFFFFFFWLEGGLPIGLFMIYKFLVLFCIFFCCSLVTFHLIFPSGVRDFW